MAKTAKKAFDDYKAGYESASKAHASTEQELRRQAADIVTERNERAFKNLVDMQGREIKMLESERTWIEQQKARDVSEFNNKEIAAINQRYDRLQHEMQRKHNSFLGKVHRVFGGHKRQQRQMKNLNAERNRVVTDRTEQHVNQEARRQQVLTERHGSVEKDLQQAKDRHAADRDQFRQHREQTFETAVAKEIHRLRHVPKPGM